MLKYEASSGGSRGLLGCCFVHGPCLQRSELIVSAFRLFLLQKGAEYEGHYVSIIQHSWARVSAGGGWGA